MDKKRCFWVKLNNPLYIKYHDEEWGRPLYDDQKLYELFVLECFQAGLSWECILNKRDCFRKAYDFFDIDKVICYDDKKIEELLHDKSIIRNKLKIKASITNSIIFREIQKEYGSFSDYLWEYSDFQVIYESCEDKTESELSIKISKDLKRRGMKFVGSTTIYSFLQACGVVNGHHKGCFLYHESDKK